VFLKVAKEKFKNSYLSIEKMQPYYHLIASSVLTAVLYPFFGVNSFFVLAGGFLIDIDHYIWCVYNFKEFNPRKVFKFYAKVNREKSYAQQRKCLIIFHSVEFLMLMIFLAFYSEIAFLILAGLLLHYMFDAIWILAVTKGTFAIYSLVWWFVRYRRSED